MKTHPTDLLSLVPGLLLTAIAVVALSGNLDIDLLAADWAWPAVLITLGVVVLASAGRGRSRDTTPTDERLEPESSSVESGDEEPAEPDR